MIHFSKRFSRINFLPDKFSYSLCHAYAYSNAVPIHMKWSFKFPNQNGNQEGSIIFVALSRVILFENPFSGLRTVACMQSGKQKNYVCSQQSAMCATNGTCSSSSSSSSYVCHGVRLLVDPFRSHVSRSLFRGLPRFLLPVGE